MLWYTSMPVLASKPFLNMVPSRTGFLGSHVNLVGKPACHCCFWAPPRHALIKDKHDPPYQVRASIVQFIETWEEHIPRQVVRVSEPILLARPAKVCSRLEGLEYIICHILTNVWMVPAPRGSTLLPQVDYTVLHLHGASNQQVITLPDLPIMIFSLRIIKLHLLANLSLMEIGTLVRQVLV
jgi:hypothetical protein